MNKTIMQTIKRIKGNGFSLASITCTPALLIDLKTVQAASAFELGALKALSLSVQRKQLEKARASINQGLPKLANYWLECWQRERAFFIQIQSI